MEELNYTLQEAIIRYFKTLSSFGYKNYNDVYKLLVLIFIHDLLSSDFIYTFTEDDLRSITNVINCISGNNCLISFTNINTSSSLIYKSIFNTLIRSNEDSTLKLSNDNNTRLIE